ncbi:MAG TPA: hypothetical protein VF016_05905 [Nitrososphaera sp.]
MEIGFYDKDKDATIYYSTTGTSKGKKLPKEIAQTLFETVGRNLWAKIHFNKKGIATEVSLEEYDFQKDLHGLKKKLAKLVIVGS